MTVARAWGLSPAEWWSLETEDRVLRLAHHRATLDPRTKEQRRKDAIRAKHRGNR